MSFKDIVIGCTGTKLGWTKAQEAGVKRYFEQYKERIHSIHLGDCIGSDADFDSMAREFGFHRIGHPPDNPKNRAFLTYDETHEEKPYGVRDKDIVDSCNVLLATPHTVAEQLRSGTWWTIRMARKAKHRPLIIIFNPDHRLDNF